MAIMQWYSPLSPQSPIVHQGYCYAYKCCWIVWNRPKDAATVSDSVLCLPKHCIPEPTKLNLPEPPPAEMGTQRPHVPLEQMTCRIQDSSRVGFPEHVSKIVSRSEIVHWFTPSASTYWASTMCKALASTAKQETKIPTFKMKMTRYLRTATISNYLQ